MPQAAAAWARARASSCPSQRVRLLSLDPLTGFNLIAPGESPEEARRERGVESPSKTMGEVAASRRKGVAAAAMVGVALLLAHGLLPCASAVDRGDFPENFLFGTSTSAYQVRCAFCC